MNRFEYKVVPAPVQGRKGKGVKGVSGRFALALEALMNELGTEGWEYVRADTLPCEERTGLTGKTTTYQNMLVFRRVAETDAAREPAPAYGAAAQPAAHVTMPPLAAPVAAGGHAAVEPAPPVRVGPPPMDPVPSGTPGAGFGRLSFGGTAGAAPAEPGPGLPTQRPHGLSGAAHLGLQVPPAILSDGVPSAGSAERTGSATVPVLSPPSPPTGPRARTTGPVLPPTMTPQPTGGGTGPSAMARTVPGLAAPTPPRTSVEAAGRAREAAARNRTAAAAAAAAQALLAHRMAGHGRDMAAE